MTQQNLNKFETLFHMHKTDIYNYAVNMLGDPDGAGDVLQDVFLRLFEKLNNGNGIIDVKNWLFICARNRCLNLIRESRLRSGPAVFSEKDSTQISENVRLGRVLRALADLPVDQREALTLKALQEFSYAEIALIMQKTVPAVRSLIYRARRQLKERFEQSPN